MNGQGWRWRQSAALLSTFLLALLVSAACTGQDDRDDGDGPVRVQPGAPGEPGQVLTEGAPGWADQPHNPADVAFLHAMLAHHAQALRMTGLVPDRTDREDIALFAERVERSQEAEIAQMQAWLEARGEPVPAADPDHADHAAGGLPPGMLTEAQLEELERASGVGFDRGFLELMITHHEGALVMVEDLWAAGGGHEAELYEMMTHIDADQRIEIERMNRLLNEPGADG